MVHRPLAFLFLCFALLGAWAQSPTPSTYVLRHGDRLQVSVWKEEALNREVRVLPDGSISFPLVGRLQVAGQSTPDVERKIKESLKTYIPEPVVSVVVLGTEGNSVYVLGKVLKPGAVALTSTDTTVLQVLSQAGGLDRFADADSIVVLRGTSADGRPQALRVRYGELLRGRALDSNVVMRAGDTVMVP